MSPRARQPNPANTRTDLLTPQAPGRAMEAPDQAYGRVTAQAQWPCRSRTARQGGWAARC